MPQTHIIEVGTSEDMDTKYLVDVLMWGLEQHNEAVRKGLPWTHQPDTDHFIEPISMTILSEEQE